MKSFWKLALSFFIAFLVFVILLFPELRRFTGDNVVQNPFDVPAPNATISLSDTDASSEVFTSDGELFIFFSPSRFTFSPNRELLAGDVFWSTSLLKNPVDSLNSLSVSEQTIHDLSQRFGVLRAGSFVFRSLGANVFFHRDSVAKTTEIFVSSGPLEIYRTDISEPFLVPAGQKVILSDNLSLSDQVFYSKLKKEYRLQKFSLEDGLLQNDALVRRLSFGLERVKFFQQKISQFVESFYATWIAGREGSLLSSFKKIQYTLAIGIPQFKKDEFSFQENVNQLVDIYSDFQNLQSVSDSRINAVFRDLTSSSWKALLLRNPKISGTFSDFWLAQRIWLRDIPSSDLRSSFAVFWNPTTPEQRMERFFSLAESNLESGGAVAVKNSLSPVKELLDTSATVFSSEFITRYRRLLVEILRSNDSFYTEDLFTLYQRFIQLELSGYKNSPILDEVSLENAQDILSFLRYFLNDRSRTNLSQILIRTYKELDVQGVQSRLGRSIFSEEDQGLIDVLFLVGDSGATREQIEILQLQTARQKNQIPSLNLPGTKKIMVAPITTASFLLRSVQDLKTFLEKNGGNTLIFTPRTELDPTFGQVTKFTDVAFGEFSVSGSFYYEGQVFQLVVSRQSAEPQTYSAVTLNTFEKMSKEWLATLPSETNQNGGDVLSGGIPQNTSTAILKRTFIQDLLQSKNIYVQRSDIAILDSEMDTFQVSEARFNQATINFQYHLAQNMVSHLTFHLQDSHQNFGESYIAFQDFPVFLESLSSARKP